MKFYPVRFVRYLFILISTYLFICILLKNSNESNVNDELRVIDERSLKDYSEISLTLEPYRIFLPNFINNESRQWFLKSTFYQMYSSQCQNQSCETNGFLFDNIEEHRRIRLSITKNGLFLNDDCGYKCSDEAVQRQFKSINDTSIHYYDEAIIYTVPDGWSFQHFLDGIGPKLSQSYRYLTEYPKSKIILQQGIRFDKSVKQIWELLGVNETDRIVFYNSNMKLGSRILINPCRMAATHPKLWQDARQLYWSLAKINQFNLRNKFIYLRRTSENSRNQGRIILNERPVIDILRKYANQSSLEFIEYDHSKQIDSIVEQIQFFSQAQIIFGVHGGAHSNINFAASGTIIIEVMPFKSEQSTLPTVCSLSSPNELKPCVGYIYYVQSQLLNHSYWILPTSVNQQNNLHIDLIHIQQLVDLLPKHF